MAEHRSLELLQGRPRLDAKLLDQRRPRRLVGGQRLRLPPRPVEGEHQLAAEPFPQRVLGDQALELGDELRTLAALEIGVDPPLLRRETELLEPRGLFAREGLKCEIGERRPAPQRERIVKRLGAALRRELLETRKVQLAGLTRIR